MEGLLAPLSILMVDASILILRWALLVYIHLSWLRRVAEEKRK